MAAVIIFILLIFVVISLFGASSYKVGNEAEEKMKKTLMVNRDFQDELVKKISNPKYKKQILELISEDLKYIYGDAWEELYLNQPWYFPKPYTTVFDSKENIIVFLMLSKSGLIPECYRFGGIQISNTPAVNLYEALRTLHCVEKNIQQKKNSLEYKLIFTPKITRDGYGKHAGPEVGGVSHLDGHSVVKYKWLKINPSIIRRREGQKYHHFKKVFLSNVKNL